eukprot:TRINITY_DN8541_c0_g1_i3.p1 TRINITY_DN8541_c0_g1~~TRINITY_DN8541_c0_g1_i3.p1  ORF type:complete len:146 (+),score=25.79 TRINITY_DN8541_c0_g1_i3:96-533(+)
MIRRPPRSTLSSSSAASDVYKRQLQLVATTARTFFGHEVDPAFPLIPIRLSTALRWSKLGLNQFSTLPTELVNQARHPGEQLLLILYNAHTSSHLTEITPAMWLSLIHISEPTRLLSISYAVFCLKKKKKKKQHKLESTHYNYKK